ncbi:phage tail sheath subtilisin-like domain-containing protein [Asticcacaulis machinosus]|uniref:Phage tail sheath subtilisin-like domain-containing protein n=1 Tax=Asticcacaulis machinosus TaxID=2984211 RepID=A0ABT5HGR5_9CAUL|nr:phage tail sheath subtilisin-like domain-containing protein [Asticcacaulis machinosus]MDC7675387.1 phage tail sheath subtilisin-like domain-containing protein [Asticcacaulis machinosus]
MPNHHGVKTLETTTGTRPSASASTAVIGIVGTAPAATSDDLPLNTPRLFTDIYAAIAAAGATGTLANALRAIADQVNPTVVVVRVTEGANPGATNINVIGDITTEGQKTGAKALLSAKSQLGVTPKIIGAPGFGAQEVTAALAVIAKQLDGFVYAPAIGENIAEAKTYRAGFAQRELMLLWPEFSDFSGSAVARAMGLRALIDQEVGWHKTLSNYPVQGVTGLSKGVHFDIAGVSTDASELNDSEITALIRDGGYRFWGNRTCSDEPLFAFETAVRSGAAVREIIRESLRWAIDKPLTKWLIKDIVDTGNAALRGLVSQGYLIGAKMWYDPAKNAASALAGGKLIIDYDYTPCAPLESLTINQRITSEYYSDIPAIS